MNEGLKGLEALLLVIVAVLGVASYVVIAKSNEGFGGFACPSGNKYLIGPGILHLTYKYSDALCGYENITVATTLPLTPEKACGRPSGLVLYMNPISGTPPGSPDVVYVDTPLGVRPAYRYSHRGLIQASACTPFMVEGGVETFYDTSTGLLLKATAYSRGATMNYTLRSLELQSYSLQSGGKMQASEAVLGATYASTAGIAGAALALAVRRLLG